MARIHGEKRTDAVVALYWRLQGRFFRIAVEKSFREVDVDGDGRCGTFSRKRPCA
jgi:hypothetical protein